MRPTARGGGRASARAIAAPSRGLTMYCVGEGRGGGGAWRVTGARAGARAGAPTPPPPRRPPRPPPPRTWARYPTPMGTGFFMHCLKSSTVRVSPMESIRNPSEYVKRSVLNQESAAGCAMPSAAPRQTQTGKRVVSVSVTLARVVDGAAPAAARAATVGGLRGGEGGGLSAWCALAAPSARTLSGWALRARPPGGAWPAIGARRPPARDRPVAGGRARTPSSRLLPPPPPSQAAAFSPHRRQRRQRRRAARGGGSEARGADGGSDSARRGRRPVGGGRQGAGRREGEHGGGARGKGEGKGQ